MPKYNPAKIEKKWQKWWQAEKLYQAKDYGKNFMLLVEFPYPSGNLHMGHWFTYSVSDIYARYLKMNGYNVMYPMGFDAFGLPAENAAIKNETNPAVWTKKNIAYMTKQLNSIGAAFDWSRVVTTSEPDYYQWTQWIFLKLYEQGLAYRQLTKVNWCPKDKTVLANEQVIDGKCDRCGTEVVQKDLTQWMFKITKFADSLIDDLDNLDWPKDTKLAQKNWVGRSEGAIVEFKITDTSQAVEVFTTRVDTIFGATYVVLAPEHPLIQNLESRINNLDEIKEYINQTKKKTELQRISEQKEKSGVELKGLTATNPMTEEKIPVWIADYVLVGYGTGAVMAVPAHDDRDSEFALKYNLPVKQVVESETEKESPIVEDGILTNSNDFTGQPSAEARKKITEILQAKGLGRLHKTYRLHDWILSRQRYWGAPIPMISCPTCGYQPVPEKDLPVILPPLKDFKPSDDGRSPLAKATKWLKVKCPTCGGPAERETDTMDTFVDSSWYFFRYTDPQNKNHFAEKEKMRKWLPVPMYIGGAEHNTMHLLYSRFIAKALYSLRLIEFSEPFLSRRNHGLILGPDRQKMSKSKGNVIDPDEQVKKYGTDTMRMNFAFLGPFEQDYPWNFESINGISRFLSRAWGFVSRFADKKLETKEGKNIEVSISRAIRDIGEDIKKMKFNTGVSGLMKLLNSLEELSVGQRIEKGHYENLLRLLAPFAPHIAEELWTEVLGNKASIHSEMWPEYDEAVLDEEKVTIVIQVNGKLRDMIDVQKGLSEEEIKKIVLEREKVKEHVGGQQIRKFIYIPDRLTNIVI